MHTYAHPAWFGADLAEPGTDTDTPMVSVTGTLAHDAEVRVRPVGPQGDAMHVVCMDLRDLVPNARALHVELPHPDRAKADACAARYRKGARITVRSPLQDVRLSMPNAQQIEIQPHLFTKP